VAEKSVQSNGELSKLTKKSRHHPKPPGAGEESKRIKRLPQQIEYVPQGRSGNWV